jgi:hypothetical protein
MDFDPAGDWLSTYPPNGLRAYPDHLASIPAVTHGASRAAVRLLPLVLSSSAAWWADARRLP